MIHVVPLTPETALRPINLRTYVLFDAAFHVRQIRTMSNTLADRWNRDFASKDVQLRWVLAKPAIPFETMLKVLKGAPEVIES